MWCLEFGICGWCIEVELGIDCPGFWFMDDLLSDRMRRGWEMEVKSG